MTTRRELLAAAALLGPLSLVAKTAQAAEEEEKTGHGAHKMADFLFVQNARGISYADGKLTLKGVNPAAVMFSDRPERIVGRVTTKDFVDNWASGDDSFKTDPPNAVLTADNGSAAEEVTLVLKSPRLEVDALVYDVDVLNGSDTLSGEWASLFIDLIGRPLTPLSYAGVARRTTRRIMWR